jgi:hypothetical protein
VVAVFGGKLQRLEILDPTNEPVSPARQGLNVARGLRRVAQRLPDASNRVVQAVVEIDKCIGGPHSALQLLPSHQVARMFEQDLEHLQGLPADALSLRACAVRRHGHPTRNRRTAACWQLVAG